MNYNNRKIGLIMKMTCNCVKIPFYFQNSFSKNIWDSTFSETEELYP